MVGSVGAILTISEFVSHESQPGPVSDSPLEGVDPLVFTLSRHKLYK